MRTYVLIETLPRPGCWLALGCAGACGAALCRGCGAKQPYETGVLHQVLAQVAHEYQALVELHQIRCGEGSIGNRGLSPIALQAALWKAFPVQGAEQIEGAPHGR